MSVSKEKEQMELQSKTNVRTRVKKPQNYLILDEFGRNHSQSENIHIKNQKNHKIIVQSEKQDISQKKIKKSQNGIDEVGVQKIFTKQDLLIYEKVSSIINKKSTLNNQIICNQQVQQKKPEVLQNRLDFKKLIQYKIQKQTNQQKIDEFYDKYGQKMNKINEPQFKVTQWDKILEEIQQKQEEIHIYKKNYIQNQKKLCKLSIQRIKQMNQLKNQQDREEVQSLKNIGYQCSKMVKKVFWKNLLKVKKYLWLEIQQNEEKDEQMMRLNQLIKKQQELSNQIAVQLQSNDKNGTQYLNLRPKKNGNQKGDLVGNLVKNRYLKGQLREYQKIGVNWLNELHCKNQNGILADEMGLGKTIQTISLLCNLAYNYQIWGPHLIVVPTSIMLNWEKEFKMWCPSLKIITYYGSRKQRKQKRMGWSQLNQFNICITSYKIIVQDQKVFRRKKWYYMVLDEAQNIKNYKSLRWQVMLNMQAKHRLLLTGTPIQNDLSELWSLLHFLMPSQFESISDFNEWFNVPIQEQLQKTNPQINQQLVSQLHQILRPMLLRRLKKDVESQLPSKTEVIVKTSLSRRQKYLYDEFINRDTNKTKLREQDFLGMMNIVIQLRKVCNHPDLFENRVIQSPFNMNYVFQFYYPSLLKGLMVSMEHKSEQKILYNVIKVEQMFSKQFQSYNQSFGEYQRVQQQTGQIKQYHDFYSEYKQKYQHHLFRVDVDRIWNQQMYDLGLVKDVECLTIDYSFHIKQFTFCCIRVIQHSSQIYFMNRFIEQPMTNCWYEKTKSMMIKYMDQFHQINIRQKLCFPSKELIIYDSGKLTTMINLLQKLKNQKKKVLIFTQMSKMLDILEIALNLNNFKYLRLDGSTRPEVRQQIVEHFNQNTKILCFISSTRSGGIGLNLTGADSVIFYDTDWNPAMDKQAQDRCHRIGQTKNVTIYRLITESTIEENILLKSIQKRKLDQCIMEEGKFDVEFFKKITVKDLLGDLAKKQEQFINYKDLTKCMKSVEDQVDVEAMDQAQQEIVEQTQSEDEDNKFRIDINQLPDIFKYGLRYIKKQMEIRNYNDC